MAVVIPDAATRWMADEELVLANFGPGVSTIAGVTNPAGPRTGVVINAETGVVTGGTRDTVTPGSLNSALLAAKYGDDIVCASQATKPGGYTGNVVIPLDAGTTGGSANKAVTGGTPMLPWKPTEPSYIRIMSADWASLPLRRIHGVVGDPLSTVDDSASLFKVKGDNSTGSAFGTRDVLSFAVNDPTNPSVDAVRQHHYWFEGMEIEAADAIATGDTVYLAEMGRINFLVANPACPSRIVFHRCWFRGNPSGLGGNDRSAVRGIFNGCHNLGLLHCRFDGFNSSAQTECSAVLMSGQGLGPVYAYNSYFEAATQCIMHGGSNNDTPRDVIYERSVFGWNPKWQVDTYTTAGTITVSGINVTLSAGTFPAVVGHSYLFVPTVAQAPVLVDGFNGTTLLTTSPAYGDRSGVAYGLLTDGMLDSQTRSVSVTVAITGTTDKTVTRSSGTFGRKVASGRYFFLLDSTTPTRYLITAVSGDRTALTLSGGPTNASGIVNWVVGTWDGVTRPGLLKNLWESKSANRALLKDCVFQDYWFDQRQNGQQWCVTFKSQGADPGSIHLTMSGCLAQRIAGFYNDIKDVGTLNGPVLIEDTLAFIGNPFPQTSVGYASSFAVTAITYRHSTFVQEEDATSPTQIAWLFADQAGGANRNWLDNLFAMGHSQFIMDLNAGEAGNDDVSLANLGIPQANVGGNVFFGGAAVTDIRTNGFLRSNAVVGGTTRYGNAALDSRTGVGFINPTGDETGDYRLQPIYTTDAAACSVTGTPAEIVSVASGTIPTTVQKGTLFRVAGDGVAHLTTVRLRDNASQVTLAAAYPGTLGAGLTGVFTYQGSASDSADPGVTNLAARLLVWADVAAGTITEPAPPATDPPVATLRPVCTLTPVATLMPVTV